MFTWIFQLTVLVSPKKPKNIIKRLINAKFFLTKNVFWILEIIQI